MRIAPCKAVVISASFPSGLFVNCPSHNKQLSFFQPTQNIREKHELYSMFLGFHDTESHPIRSRRNDSTRHVNREQLFFGKPSFYARRHTPRTTCRAKPLFSASKHNVSLLPPVFSS